MVDNFLWTFFRATTFFSIHRSSSVMPYRIRGIIIPTSFDPERKNNSLRTSIVGITAKHSVVRSNVVICPGTRVVDLGVTVDSDKHFRWSGSIQRNCIKFIGFSVIGRVKMNRNPDMTDVERVEYNSGNFLLPMHLVDLDWFNVIIQNSCISQLLDERK